MSTEPEPDAPAPTPEEPVAEERGGETEASVEEQANDQPILHWRWQGMGKGGHRKLGGRGKPRGKKPQGKGKSRPPKKAEPVLASAGGAFDALAELKKNMKK